MQLTAAAVANWPGAQGVHCNAPGPAKAPAGQFRATVVLGQKFPAGHVVHVDDPRKENVGLVHAWQTLCPGRAATDPAGHGVEIPKTQKLPALQLPQRVGLVGNNPAPQTTHVVLLLDTAPGGHGTAAKGVRQIFPSGQPRHTDIPVCGA